MGVGFTFPGEGRIVGAELSFKDGMNIPDRVLFGDYNQIRSWTDGNGEVFLKMIGKGQKEELPDSVKAVDMEYSILVSAQPEESGLNTMVNILFGELTFGTVPGPAGVISSLIDILKTFTFDMGEHVFPMIDWESKVYRASGSSEGSISGIICDLEKPFTLYELAADNGGTYELIFTPTSADSGNMAYSGSAESCKIPASCTTRSA